jgi:hypothetical protein
MPKDVLMDMDNEVEFVGVFRPPKRSTKEAIKLFLYNSEAGTVLGRTGVSWGKDVLLLFVTCNIFIRFLLRDPGIIGLLRRTCVNITYTKQYFS